MKVRKRQLIDRILAGALALLMIITMVPQTAFISKAAKDIGVYVYSGNHDAADEVLVNLSTNGGYSVSGTTNDQGRVTISINEAHKDDNFTATVSSDDYEVVSTTWSNPYYVENQGFWQMALDLWVYDKWPQARKIRNLTRRP